MKIIRRSPSSFKSRKDKKTRADLDFEEGADAVLIVQTDSGMVWFDIECKDKATAQRIYEKSGVQFDEPSTPANPRDKSRRSMSAGIRLKKPGPARRALTADEVIARTIRKLEKL